MVFLLVLESLGAIATLVVIHIVNLGVDLPEVVVDSGFGDLKVVKYVKNLLVDKFGFQLGVFPVNLS